MKTSRKASTQKTGHVVPLALPESDVETKRPGKSFDPSPYIKHLKKIEADGQKVVACVRVSRHEQKSKLKAQKKKLEKILDKRGFETIRWYAGTFSGKLKEIKGSVDFRVEAAKYAIKKNAILVFESPSRVLRAAKYTKEAQDEQPTRAEWEKLMHYMENVTIATVSRPSISSRKERSRHTKRGMAYSKSKPGRPKTKRGKYGRRSKSLAVRRIIVRAHLTDKRSLREISASSRVPHTTIQSIVKKAKKRLYEI